MGPANLTFLSAGFFEMIGAAVGNYKVVAQLGSGSMGVVFLGEHQRLARRAAIKVLTPELVRDQRALQRFFTEARATSLIRHPGIVEVFDCDVDATGRAYMVMEYLEGDTLADQLRRAGKLHWTAACLIGRQVADALASAHDKGIVHRDLKPENVFLVADGGEPTGAVKVLDFGVAKLLASDAAARLTMRGTLIGTPEYMSPEQCGGAEVDHRADIYALGCILFEMLSGHPPFVTSSLRALVVAHRFRPAPLPGKSGSHFPAWLGDLMARMLAKDPAQRPSSMHEVSKTLRESGAAHPAPTRPIVLAPEPGSRRDGWRAITGWLAATVRQIGARRAGAAIAVTVLVLGGAIWALRRNTVVAPPIPTRATVLATARIAPATLVGSGSAAETGAAGGARQLRSLASPVPAARSDGRLGRKGVKF